jgi:hypothetical protein
MGLWDFMGFGLMRETSLVTHHVSRITYHVSRIRGCQSPEFLKNPKNLAFLAFLAGNHRRIRRSEDVTQQDTAVSASC